MKTYPGSEAGSGHGRARIDGKLNCAVLCSQHYVHLGTYLRFLPIYQKYISFPLSSKAFLYTFIGTNKSLVSV